MNLQPGVQIGDFRIERLLGQGGMGIVFLANQVSLNRLVALKIMGPALIQQADITRFQREAQAVARLNHPMIAKVYFVGQEQNYTFQAIEYIDGDSLKIVLNRLRAVRDPKQPISSILQLDQHDESVAPNLRFDVPQTGSYVPPPPPDLTQADQDSLTPEAKQLIESKDYIRWCCEVVRDVAKALDHAHKQGVIHRDIKPENLLLDRQGQVHIIDFGLARFFEDVSVTGSGMLIGTPPYMSPEQVTGRIAVDHRTDIYSLGLVLYEMLTLRRPIQAPTREGVLRKVVTKELPPLSWGNAGISRKLESVVHKATAKDSDDRYQSAIEFSNDLQNFLLNKDVSANQYRYKFDTKEIYNSRPTHITITAFLYLGLTMYLIIEELTDMNYTLNANNSNNASLYVGIFIIFTYFFTSLHISFALLTARKASFFSIFFQLLINLIFTLLGFIAVIYLPFNEDNIQALLFFNIFTIFNIISMVQLFVFSSRCWFALAKRLRSEHKRYASPR